MSDNNERLTTFLATCCLVISRFLQAKYHLSPEVANELARDLTHDICIECGPAWIYVPKDGGFDLTRRDREIYDRYNGRNLHELARQYNITHTRILQIVAKVKTEEQRKRQPALPGIQ